MKSRLLAVALVLVVQLACNNVLAAQPSNFAAVNLPQGISLQVPNGWRLLSADAKKIIDTSTEAALDLSGIGSLAGQEVNLIAANSMPASTYAAVRVDVTTPSTMTPTLFAQLTARDILEMDGEMERNVRLMLRQQGLVLIDFLGLRTEKISGFSALVTEYRRSGPKGPVLVQINQVFMARQSYTVNLSYRESEAIFWKPVIAKIRRSIVIARE